MRNAKELCAMLITRSLQDLNEDEEEIVVDYLENIGIETNLDMKPKELCYTLLDKIKDKKIPLTAYANSILSKEENIKFEREEKALDRQRLKTQKNLENTKLPGCIPDDGDILSKGLYDLKVDPSLGIIQLNDGTAHYSSVISLSNDLYQKIFLRHENPILEIINSKGYKTYSRIGEPHNGPSNLILLKGGSLRLTKEMSKLSFFNLSSRSL